MDENSWRKRVSHWLMSHGLFEVVKLIFIPAFVWLISVGYTRLTHEDLGKAFNIFLVLIGLIALLWLLGFVRLPTFNKKVEPGWEVFFYSPVLPSLCLPALDA
jgi:hypothetical protein